MINELAYTTEDFSHQYLSLRKKEGRVYSDSEVARLPETEYGHRYQTEWLIRRASCNRLIEYLETKKEPLEILEIGCGNGWLSAKLSEIQSATVTGIDVNDEELNQAKRVFHHFQNLTFFNWTLQNEMLNDRQFDVIVFAASIQYFSSLTGIINEALRKLKPSGEIHILDSHFYKQKEISAARQRSKNYFRSLDFPQMASCYFHHSLNDLEEFDHKILYDPHSILNKFKKIKNPFYWICIKSNG